MEYLVRIRNEAMYIGSMARELDKGKRYKEALDKYIECLEYLKYIIKCKLYIIV